MTILFSNSSPKKPKSSIFGRKFRHYFLIEFPQLGKFEGGDFNFDNIDFKFQPKNTFGIFVFSQNFANRQV